MNGPDLTQALCIGAPLQIFLGAVSAVCRDARRRPGLEGIMKAAEITTEFALPLLAATGAALELYIGNHHEAANLAATCLVTSSVAAGNEFFKKHSPLPPEPNTPK